MFYKLFFAVVWFYISIASEDVYVTLWFCLLTITLLYIKTQNIQLIFRSFKLLLWLLVPIVLLHGLLTPGTYIHTPIYMPLSIEGLLRALDLCLHILLMFFTALLVMNLLRSKDTIYFLRKIPNLGMIITVYWHLLSGLNTIIKEEISQQKSRWLSMRNKWFKLPDMLVKSIISILKKAQQEALDLWTYWDIRMVESVQNVYFFKASKSDIVFTMLALVALMFLWVR